MILYLFICVWSSISTVLALSLILVFLFPLLIFLPINPEIQTYQSFLYAIPLTFSCCFILVSMTPIGEYLLKKCHGLRQPTQAEQTTLRPLFQEVLHKAQLQNPNKICLYLFDNPMPQAISLKDNIIALSTGLIQYATEEEIKACIAHELGHIIYGDCTKQLACYAATLPTLLLKVGLGASAVIGRMLASIFIILLPMVFIINLSLQLFMFINVAMDSIQLFILRFCLRRREFRADKFAAQLGYAEGLKSFLIKLNHMQVTQEGLAARLMDTHPLPMMRVARIDKFVKPSL